MLGSIGAFSVAPSSLADQTASYRAVTRSRPAWPTDIHRTSFKPFEMLFWSARTPIERISDDGSSDGSMITAGSILAPSLCRKKAAERGRRCVKGSRGPRPVPDRDAKLSVTHFLARNGITCPFV